MWEFPWPFWQPPDDTDHMIAQVNEISRRMPVKIVLLGSDIWKWGLVQRTSPGIPEELPLGRHCWDWDILLTLDLQYIVRAEEWIPKCYWLKFILLGSIGYKSCSILHISLTTSRVYTVNFITSFNFTSGYRKILFSHSAFQTIIFFLIASSLFSCVAITLYVWFYLTGEFLTT